MTNEERLKKARQDLYRSLAISAFDSLQTAGIIIGVSASVTYFLKHYYPQES